MSEDLILTLIVFGSFILACLVPAAFFIYRFIKEIRLKNRCTVPLSVRCIEIKETTFRNSRGHRSSEISYKPIFEGIMNGERAVFEPKYYSHSKYNDICVGDHLTIMINKNNKDEWIIPGDSNAIGFAMLAVILIATALIILYKAFG